eukprot:scaffold150983_cov26-Cyclotella_meneghiniana.AAC.2
MEVFVVKWIASQRPLPSEGAFRLQKFDAATTVVESIALYEPNRPTQWLTMVDMGVERTSVKFGSLDVLLQPWRSGSGP